MNKFCATFYCRDFFFQLRPYLFYEKYATLAERSAKIREAAGSGRWLRIEAQDVTRIYRLDPARKAVATYEGLFDFGLVPVVNSYVEPAPCAATRFQLIIDFGPVAPFGVSARVKCASHEERMKMVDFLTNQDGSLTLGRTRLKICELALSDITVAYEKRNYIGQRDREYRIDRNARLELKRLMAGHAPVSDGIVPHRMFL